MQDGATIGEFTFQKAEKSTLPVVYEADRLLKENIKSEDLQEYPLLKLICNDDGTLKSYREIIADKEQAKKEHKNDELITRKDSVNDFKEDTKRSVSTQIENVYTIIINSDPMLYLEDCLNYNRNNKIRELFETTPELINVYENTIRNTVCRYVNINNYENLKDIFTKLKSDNIANSVDRRIKQLVKSDIQKQLGIEIYEYMTEDEEMIKDIKTLENEESSIYSRLQEKVSEGKFDEKTADEYIKIVNSIYEEYKRESIKNNPNQSISSEERNSSQGIESDELYEELGDIIDFIDEDLYQDKMFIELCNRYKELLITEEDIKRISESFRREYKEYTDRTDNQEETEKIDDIREL